ncbi:hypothetical protein AWB80_01315 [Caballeronia pedi]|uniref:Uncharacterized protein n=1 Tax=Caballeronia pedi TaxID=1777141 RepID=A0A157ZUQ3_9BURK|nr:hypothetical protein [Caballeronia pedi]SAK49196.1 hypothetical protein AWB80_01315 [Caballeronia pedi]
MQTSWSREKYALNVRVQGLESKVIEPACRTMAGFLAVVTISLSSAATPAFPRLMLGDDGGIAFDSESDALAAGIAAANRMVDDLAG